MIETRIIKTSNNRIFISHGLLMKILSMFFFYIQDMQGVKQIKNTNLNPLYVFIHPPSVDDLEKRLRGRGTETEESLQRRLAAAKAEMEFGTPDNFDKVVVNDDVDKVEGELVDFLKPHIEELEMEQEKTD